ncbi:MAG TPA: NADH-quinone oxidoreductase subunit M [Candidatus Dormibacteraeota bacterium]|jgi:NADH-quinone oxidoreductase subunit M|nr:NADH-quinone oxidoreductase subunit M [Candidatus Dormibacteraeota bacterium]
MNSIPWLTLVLVVPLGTVVLLQLVPHNARTLIKAVTIVGTLATAAIVAGLVVAFTQNPAPAQVALPQGGTHVSPITFQFEEQREWISQIGASYHLGLDGVSAWLLALDAGVFLLGALVVSARSTDRLKFYCGLLLLSETATAGVLLSVDLLLFYLFWEAMLIPLYFLLSNYGDSNRGRATLKFVIYTAAGSLLMLIAIIYLYFQSPPPPGSSHASFDLTALMLNPGPAQGVVHIPVHIGSAINADIPLLTPIQFAFIAFFLAFAIKVPLVPFHTWLPDSYTSCPPAALVFFAGIVSKLGAFGFIRYGLTLFPGPVHDYRWILEALAILSIVYGALMALAQVDIKRIVAYASVSHLGFVVLGIFALNANGINGAVIQMVNHGIIIASLFLIVGMIEQRTGTRDRHQLAGLEKRMPWLYAFFLVVTLAGLGMPGMNTFVGEFTIMLGAFQASWILAVLAGTGVILACWYMLRLHQGLMHEPPKPATEGVRDIGTGERLVLVPLVGLMVLIGVFPRPIGDVARSNVSQYVTVANGAQPVAQAPQQ